MLRVIKKIWDLLREGISKTVESQYLLHKQFQTGNWNLGKNTNKRLCSTTVVQLICNQQVDGSNPSKGTMPVQSGTSQSSYLYKSCSIHDAGTMSVQCNGSTIVSKTIQSGFKSLGRCQIGMSFNSRTIDFDSINLGAIPSVPAKWVYRSMVRTFDC